MGYSILQVFIAAAAETQCGIEFLEVGLCADTDWAYREKIKRHRDGLVHQFPSLACIPMTLRTDYPADTAFFISDARGNDTAIGCQLTFFPSRKMQGGLVLIIRILVNAILLHHENFISQTEDGI